MYCVPNRHLAPWQARPKAGEPGRILLAYPPTVRAGWGHHSPRWWIGFDSPEAGADPPAPQLNSGAATAVLAAGVPHTPQKTHVSSARKVAAPRLRGPMLLHPPPPTGIGPRPQQGAGAHFPPAGGPRRRSISGHAFAERMAPLPVRPSSRPEDPGVPSVPASSRPTRACPGHDRATQREGGTDPGHHVRETTVRSCSV